MAASDVNDVHTEFSGVAKLKQHSDAQGDTSPNSDSNADRKTDELSVSDSPALSRSATVPTRRASQSTSIYLGQRISIRNAGTTSPESTPSLERSKTTNDIPQVQERDWGRVAPTLQFPLPPSFTPHSTPTSYSSQSSRTQDSGYAVQSQASSPLSTSQPFQQPPRPPARPTPAIRPPVHLLASRRSQSVSHSPAQKKMNMNGGGSTGAGLARSNTSIGVIKGSHWGAAKQGIGVGMGGRTGSNDILPSPSQDQSRKCPCIKFYCLVRP